MTPRTRAVSCFARARYGRRVERGDAVAARLAAAAAARAGLAEAGLARAADASPEDTAYFLAAELAAVLEQRRGLILDPATLDAAALDALRAREPAALTDLEPRPRPGALVLLEAGERIGTVCFDDFEGMSPYAQISSLYVAPRWRARGVASHLLDGVAALLSPAYAGLSLTTYWSWQRAVRFYLRHGCVVRQWKHGLVFLWRVAGVRWDVAFAGDVASFTWTRAGAPARTWTARRQDGWLHWDEPSPYDIDWSDGTMTFGLLLAMAGWPLDRSPATRAEAWRWLDCGYSEGLAARIERWEALDRSRGFVVDTPRIPGIAYRSRAELGDE